MRPAPRRRANALWTSVSAAWAVSVAFAYITNREWVFQSRARGIKNVLRECLTFFALRAGTYFMDLLIVWFFVDYLGFSETLRKYAVKLASNVLVVIVNYFFSKFIVFRRPGG